jgi:hypothetical protein
MAILVSKLKSDLRPWIMINVPPERLDTLQDSDFEAIFNYVARDINDLAQVRTERFYQKATADNAEDDDLTNYLVQGRIRKVFELIFNDDAAWNQFYTYTEDRLVFKNAVAENTIIDMLYLRDIEEIDIDQDADQVDIPQGAYHEYVDLVKNRIKNDYSAESDMEYNLKLNALVKQIIRRVPQPVVNQKEVKPSWFGVDNRYYDITGRYIGLENFIVDVNGNYSHVDS